MSVQAISWAMSMKAGSPVAKVVLLCIANYADPKGRCWPAQATIARQTEQSVDTVQRRIKDLEKKGLLIRHEREQQNGKAGGKFFYQLQLHLASTLADDDEQTTPQIAARSETTTPQGARDQAAPETKPRRTGAALTAIKPSIENPLKSLPGIMDDWPEDYFDQFWKLYPPGRKGEKKAVEAKLARIRKDRLITFGKLMEGLGRYAGTNPDPKFTPAPMVWLNKGRWDVEIVDRRPGSAGLTMLDIAMGRGN